MNPAYPRGHFYSPVVNPLELEQDIERIWGKPGEDQSTAVLAGISFDEHEHRRMLTAEFAPFFREFDYPRSEAERRSAAEFFSENLYFSGLDSRLLYALLRSRHPQRMIEVGSGFSTLLTADINNRYLNNQCAFTSIDPHVADFISETLPGLHQLLRQRVQDVPHALFTELARGDILFIDSSHVAKTGSDVTHLFFEVLPRLAAGVLIHIHDIFLPAEYPKAWVLEQGRSWNEQYLVRALLMYSTEFRIVFGSSYASLCLAETVRSVFDGKLHSGGSLWIEKLPSDM